MLPSQTRTSFEQSWSEPRLWASHHRQPVTFSTSVALANRLHWSWDTNGYYRELGVPFDATKQQIKWAYRKKRGWRSPRLTYIMKQLLDPQIRALYDATPLGQVFRDAYVEEAIRRATIEYASKLRAAGLADEADHLVEQYEAESPFSEFDSEVDSGEYARQTYRGTDDWPWAFYLWQSNCRNTERLKAWQEQLISAFAERKEVRDIAVGYLGSSLNQPLDIRQIGYRLVIFLNEELQPDEALAQTAASRVSGS